MQIGEGIGNPLLNMVLKKRKKKKEKGTLKRHKKRYLSIPLTAYTNSSLELSKRRPMEPKLHLISIW